MIQGIPTRIVCKGKGMWTLVCTDPALIKALLPKDADYPQLELMRIERHDGPDRWSVLDWRRMPYEPLSDALQADDICRLTLRESEYDPVQWQDVEPKVVKPRDWDGLACLQVRWRSFEGFVLEGGCTPPENPRNPLRDRTAVWTYAEAKEHLKTAQAFWAEFTDEALDRAKLKAPEQLPDEIDMWERLQPTPLPDPAEPEQEATEEIPLD